MFFGVSRYISSTTIQIPALHTRWAPQVLVAAGQIESEPQWPAKRPLLRVHEKRSLMHDWSLQVTVLHFGSKRLPLEGRCNCLVYIYYNIYIWQITHLYGATAAIITTTIENKFYFNYYHYHQRKLGSNLPSYGQIELCDFTQWRVVCDFTSHHNEKCETTFNEGWCVTLHHITMRSVRLHSMKGGVWLYITSQWEVWDYIQWRVVCYFTSHHNEKCETTFNEGWCVTLHHITMRSVRLYSMKGGKTHCHGCMDVTWALFWGKAGAGNLVFFRVKWLRPAMKGTSCVRRVRLGSNQARLVPPLCSAMSGCSRVRSSIRFLTLWLQIAV